MQHAQLCLSRISNMYNLTDGRDYSDYVKIWQLKGFQNSIRITKRVYSTNNKFLGQKALLTLCENLAPKRTYKISQNGQKDLLNR